jgi:hypothetical protein
VPFERDDPRFFLIPDGTADLFSAGRVSPSPIWSSLQDQAIAYLLELKGEFSESFSWSTRFQAQVFGEAAVNRSSAEIVTPIGTNPQNSPKEPQQSTIAVADTTTLPTGIALAGVGASAFSIIALAAIVVLIRRSRSTDRSASRGDSTPTPSDPKKLSAEDAAASFSSKFSEAMVVSPKLLLDVPGPGSARARKSLTTKTNSPRVNVK